MKSQHFQKQVMNIFSGKRESTDILCGLVLLWLSVYKYRLKLIQVLFFVLNMSPGVFFKRNKMNSNSRIARLQVKPLEKGFHPEFKGRAKFFFRPKR